MAWLGAESVELGSPLSLAVSPKAGQNQQLHDIRKDVTAIKHEAIGVYRGRRANINAAFAAVNEVLDLAEALSEREAHHAAPLHSCKYRRLQAPATTFENSRQD